MERTEKMKMGLVWGILRFEGFCGIYIWKKYIYMENVKGSGFL